MRSFCMKQSSSESMQRHFWSWIKWFKVKWKQLLVLWIRTRKVVQLIQLINVESCWAISVVFSKTWNWISVSTLDSIMTLCLPGTSSGRYLRSTTNSFHMRRQRMQDRFVLSTWLNTCGMGGQAFAWSGPIEEFNKTDSRLLVTSPVFISFQWTSLKVLWPCGWSRMVCWGAATEWFVSHLAGFGCFSTWNRRGALYWFWLLLEKLGNVLRCKQRTWISAGPLNMPSNVTCVMVQILLGPERCF